MPGRFNAVSSLRPRTARRHTRRTGFFEQRPEIFLIPDILCNAGGVVVSYFEWVQDLQSFFWNETEVTDKLFRILEGAFTQTLNLSRKQKMSMRQAALKPGGAGYGALKKVRGLFPGGGSVLWSNPVAKEVQLRRLFDEAKGTIGMTWACEQAAAV